MVEKMTKSYNNIIPLLSTEKELKKAVMKIVTNSQEPGEPKDWRDNTLFSIYSSFAGDDQIQDLKSKYEDGIGWGDAKNIVFEELNKLLMPIRERYEDLKTQEDYVEDVLQENAKKVRESTKATLESVKSHVGLKTN